MKKIVFVVLTALTVSAIADAQSQKEVGYAADMSLTPGIDKRPLFEKLLVEGAVGASTSHHDTRIADISLRIGYRFTPRFHAYALAGADLALCKGGDTRTWNTSNHFGVGLGYTLYNNSGRNNWDMRASWAHSIGNTSWKQSQYDASIMYSPRRTGSATFSLGFKHVQSHTSGMPNLNLVYGSIGFRF